MEKKKIRNYQIFSAIFVILLGALLHFTYKLSGENSFVAMFSAVNESTWEHLKLIFFPMLISTLIGYHYIGKSIQNFLCSKTIGILFTMLFIVLFFYIYTGILGKNIAIVDIASFVIAVVLGEIISYKLMLSKFKCNKKIAIFIMVIVCISFIIFTFNAPNIGLFKDPLTGTYGI